MNDRFLSTPRRIVTLTTMMGLAFFALAIWQFTSDRKNLAQIHSESLVSLEQSVRFSLARYRERYLNTVADYTVWSEFSNFTSGKGEFSPSNFTTVRRTLSLSAVFVLDAQGRPLMRLLEPGSPRFGTLLAELAASRPRSDELKTYVVLESGRVYEASLGGVFDGENEARKGPPTGWLILVREIDQAYLSELGDMSGSLVTLHRGIAPEGSPRDTRLGDLVHVVPLTARDGKPIASLRVLNHRPSILAAGTMLNRNAAIILLFGLSLTTALFLVSARWIRRPLEDLTLSLKTGDSAVLNRLAAQSTDFAELARTMQAFFRQRKELERASEQAQSASRAKAQLLANLSHEIRTPMNGILGMTRMILDEEVSGRVRGHAETVIASSEALLQVLNDALDLSKLEAGKLILSPEPTDLVLTTQEVCRLFAPAAAARKVTLLWEVEPDFPGTVVTDPVRIRQVMMNLVGNAVKFTGEGQVLVRLGVDERTRRWTVSVEDTGIGIPAPMLPAIFEAFEQAHSHTKRYGGTGLGLPISRTLVELMGGTLTVTSEEHVGSTFLVSIPLAGEVEAFRDRRLEGRVATLLGLSPSVHRSMAYLLRRYGAELVPPTQATGDTLVFWGGDSAEVAWLQEKGARTARVAPLTHAQGGPTPGEQLPVPVMVSELLAFVEGTVVADPKRRRPERPLGLRVLVAEDNAVNQKLAIYLLKKLGCRVSLAENGELALKALEGDDFDAVLMDVQMPVMDGLLATKEIRRRERRNQLPRLRIIAATANAGAEDARSCLEAGMDAVIPKPFHEGDLRAALLPLVAKEAPNAA